MRDGDQDGDSSLEDDDGGDHEIVAPLEEMEPSVNQVHVDAACLENHLIVRLQPYHVHNHYEQHNNNKEDTGLVVSPSFIVPSLVMICAVDWPAPVLCYGAHAHLVIPSSAEDDEGHYSNMCLGVVEATNQVCLLKGRDQDNVEHNQLL